MDKRCCIGVFDSGVGGVSVLKQIVKLLPNENIIYFGDTKNIPYGDKTKEEIQKLSKRIVEFLITNNCKALVIACNTISIATLEELKSHSNIPIIGIIDAGVEAVSSNGYSEISVLGTVFTINSGVHAEKIKKKNKKMTVNSVPCEKLCPMIEEGWEKFENRQEILADYMSNVPKSSEAVLLACTHYPFIQKDIEKMFNGKIIDPSSECARELFRILKKEDILTTDKEKGKVEFYVTGDKENFREKAEKFLGSQIRDIYKVNI